MRWTKCQRIHLVSINSLCLLRIHTAKAGGLPGPASERLPRCPPASPNFLCGRRTHTTHHSPHTTPHHTLRRKSFGLFNLRNPHRTYTASASDACCPDPGYLSGRREDDSGYYLVPLVADVVRLAAVRCGVVQTGRLHRVFPTPITSHSPSPPLQRDPHRYFAIFVPSVRSSCLDPPQMSSR